MRVLHIAKLYPPLPGAWSIFSRTASRPTGAEAGSQALHRNSASSRSLQPSITSTSSLYKLPCIPLTIKIGEQLAAEVTRANPQEGPGCFSARQSGWTLMAGLHLLY